MLYGVHRFVIECPAPLTTIFLAMKTSIIFISALSLVAMMLPACDSIPSAYNPFAPDESTTTSTSGSPVTSQTNRPTYQMPLGRSAENSVPTDY
jgi:hypothetical protein